MDIARLFTGAVQKDRREFDQLVNRCHRQAYNVAYRMTGNSSDAEDLTQESFSARLSILRPIRPQSAFENWLFRIMSRVFIDELRKRRN